ncbi:MAG: hypothetical protein AAFX99_08620 [Myxococcota bacterium]
MIYSKPIARTLLIAVTLTLLIGCATTPTVEVYLASAEPGPNMAPTAMEGTTDTTIYVSSEAIIDADDIAAYERDGDLIRITLTPEARDMFAAATLDHVNNPMAIVVDGKIISAPKILETITSGKIQVQLQ